MSVLACLRAFSNDKSVKQEREVGLGGAAGGEEQLVNEGWVEFLRDLILCLPSISLLASRFPPETTVTFLLISPPQSLLSTSHLFPLFCGVPCRVRGRPAESPFQYDGRVYSLRDSITQRAAPDLASLSICDHVMEMDTVPMAA